MTNNERILVEAIVGTLKAIDHYPEHKHPMTASEAILKMALLSVLGRDAVTKLLAKPAGE